MTHSSVVYITPRVGVAGVIVVPDIPAGISSPTARCAFRLGVLGTVGHKLQALVYDILPSTTAVFSYAIGSRKLSANEHFFVGAQTAVSFLQTTQIKRGESFIAANKVYTSRNKTTIV